MRRSIFAGLAIATTAAAGLVVAPTAVAGPGPTATSPVLTLTGQPDVIRPRGHAKAGGARASSPVMTYHGGKILNQAVVKAFFRGTSWGTYAGDKITGVDSFWTGYSGSPYAAAATEYTGTNGRVGTTVTAQGHYIDTKAETSRGSATAVLAEIAAGVTASGTVIDASGNSVFALYSDQPRGNSGFCAWHSAGTINGKPVQFQFYWNLDNDPGCDPQDTSGLHSQGLAALANVSGHEMSETFTDPSSPGAWYDRSGAENGDKCAWTWGASLVSFPNGTQWKVQGEWSNAAYSKGSGYANSQGQKGCLSGA